MFNLLFYLPVVFNYSVIETNDTLACAFNNQYSQNLRVYVYITLNSGYITFQRKCFVANEYITQKCK